MAGRATLKSVPPKAQRRPPARLQGRAKAIYDAMAPELTNAGLLRDRNQPLFRILCTTLAVAEKAGAKLADVEAPGANPQEKRVADPAWRGFRDAAELALKYGIQFGLTPASQERIKRSAEDDEDDQRLLA